MKKHFINALVAVGLLATLSSCSKEEQTDLKPVKTMAHPLDPGNYGYYQVVTGENYYYNDSLSTFGRATENYLKLKPLSMEKYKNGSLLDSVCNQDLAVRFESKMLKTHSKATRWGSKPDVTEEYAPNVTVNISDTVFVIKMSKMVSAIGFELNAKYKTAHVGVNIRYWNSKTNKSLPRAGGTMYLNSQYPDPNKIPFGEPGGARVWGVESVKPFDEIRISIEAPTLGRPAPPGPYGISLAGFRYKLAK